MSRSASSPAPESYLRAFNAVRTALADVPGGTGGVGNGGRNEEPLISFEMPTFGAGVYCAADSTVSFTGCTFEDNITSGVQAGVGGEKRSSVPHWR